MARKFKIGDKVKVVKKVLDDPLIMGVNVGHTGIVIEIDKYVSAPYRIERKNGDSDWFNVRELERVK